MFNTRIECQQVKAGVPASIGIMVEVSAPEAPVNNINVRKPAGIVFVVDRSGSMGGGRLEMVKQTMLDILGRLNKDDYLSVVTFDNMANVVLALTRIGDLDIKQVRQQIGAIQTGGNTNLEAGYRLGLAEASSGPENLDVTLLLLSDGQANAGCVDADELGRLAAAATEHLVTTSTLGIGQGYDERILAAVANTGNGNHIAALNLAEATEGLAEEIDGLLQRTISNLVIKIERIGDRCAGSKLKTPQYVRKQTDDGRIAEFHVGDLGSLEERNFIFELKLPAVADLGDLVAAKPFITVEYFDELTGKQTSREIGLFDINQVNENDWVEPARDEDIVMELATLRAADTMEEAMRLMRAGRGDEAREMLRTAGLELQQLEQESTNMSARNRVRASSHYVQIQEMSYLSDIELLKRGEERLNRTRRSKPERKPKTDEQI